MSLLKTGEDLILQLEVVNVLFAVGILFTAIRPIPYGRYCNSMQLSGITVRGKNVWKLFCPGWIIPIFIMYFTRSPFLTRFPNKLAIFLFVTHYVYRSLIYPMKYVTNASPWTIEFALFALLGCSLNGFIIGYHLTNVYEVPSIGYLSSIGLLLFITGFAINITHDGMLNNLRRRQQTKAQSTEHSSFEKPTSQESKYCIPRGGLFEFVSAANYFGEIIEWWGWALFSGGLPQFSFAMMTTMALGVRGYQHHQFYKNIFSKSYPVNRRAIIPFIL